MSGTLQESNTPLDRQMSFWAKLGSGAYPEEMHPVVCHLVDVGFVAQSLWWGAVGKATRTHWSSKLQVEPEVAGQWMSFWAAIHDIGKITPAFQFRCKSARVRLSGMGFKVSPGPAWPHGLCSAVVLKSELASHRPGTYQPLGADLARDVAKVVGGHHGVIPTTAQLSQVRLGLGRGLWESARVECIAMVAEALGMAPVPAPAHPVGAGSAFHLFLAGLVAVADWVGSNRRYFRAVGNAVTSAASWAQYVDTSAQTAAKAVLELGFTRWKPKSTGRLSFSDVLPQIGTPRPLQEKCVEIAIQCHEPQLILIEAPMGEGKTEAAVYLADYATHVLGQRGLFIALPSQATANQMFSRVRRWLESRYSGGEESQRINLQLSHGRSGYSAEYAALLSLAAVADDEKQEGAGSADDGTAPTVVAESWFAQGRKQQILAPFGVGTVDQVLMSVLRTQHHFVRLFGLSGKTVILDEVHAYDAYMSTLLERLITWLAALGCTVVLLSATLPAGRRQRLIDAYSGQKHRCLPAPYPRITVTTAGGGAPRSLSFPADPARALQLEVEWIEESLLTDGLKSVLTDGGCCAVICNTVSKCQALYAEISSRVAPQDFEILIFHSRYTVADRTRIERSVLDRLGPPDAGGCRPKRLILIATQVVEQSLDLDFDLLVSEVAPVDLLLQRTGRLHRHRRDFRPVMLRQPRLWLLRPTVDDRGLPTFRGFGSTITASGAHRAGVYDRYILLRTWLNLGGRHGAPQTIALPSDIDRLVSAVYEPEDVQESDDLLQADLQQSKEGMQCAIHISETNAASVRIRSPEACDLLETSNVILDEDNPAVHADLRASTRESDLSIVVIVLWQRDAQVFCDVESTHSVDLENARAMSREHTNLLLQNAVSISRKSWAHYFLKQAVPTAWRKIGALCYSRALLLDSDSRFGQGQQYIEYNSVLGLSYGTPVGCGPTDTGEFENQ